MPTKGFKLGMLILMVGVAVGVLATLAVARLNIGWHHLELKTYVDNGDNIKADAPVRLAGIDVGRVRSVLVRPEHAPQAVEIVMDINTPHELNIPNDAVTQLETAGVLGETYVNIRLPKATSPPAGNGGVLASEPTASVSLKQIIDVLEKKCPSAKYVRGECSQTYINAR